MRTFDYLNRLMRGMRPGKSVAEGFTLLELMIAIVILAIGLLGTATILTTNINSNSIAQRLTVEASVGASVVEEIMARPGSDAMFLANSVNALYDLDQGSAATTRVVQGRTYSAVYSVTTNTPVAGVSTLSVTITNGTRNITFTALKSIL